MKSTHTLNLAAFLAASVSTASGQALFGGGSEVIHQEQADNSANVSVFDGKASWQSTDVGGGPGTFSGTIGDGTLLDYAFYNIAGREGGTGLLTPYVAGSAEIIGDAASPDENTSGSHRRWISLWTVTDPGVGFSSTADYVGNPFNTGIRTGLTTGVIDVSTLTTGSVYFLCGSFNDDFEITATLSGTGLPDINASGGVVNPGTVIGDQVGSVITTLYFDTNGGAYDTITWTYTNVDADGSRGSLHGIAIDEGAIPDPDQDGDGMTDDYEDANGLDKTDDGTLFPDLGPDGDIDFDGISNLQEHDGLNASNVAHGFGQTLASEGDSDFDGLFDDEEIGGTVNPFQTDVPGDAATAAPGLATNPNLADTDGDGVTDEEEVFGSTNTANGEEETNPNTEDTDGDMMSDGYEIAANLNGGLDPNTNDANENTDGDSLGLTNIDEFLGTTLGVPTRPDKLDTDDDGYEDIVEDSAGSWLSITATGTDPTNPDWDGDGLLDGEENPDLPSFPGAGVVPTNSDPFIADTDLDGVLDGYEVNNLGSDTTLADSDADGHLDIAEVYLYGTDPNVMEDVPSPEQLAELRVNFQPDGAEVPAGFQAYEALHEQLETFDDQIYSAFGTNITVGLSWDDGGVAVNPEAPQLFNRGDNPTEWPQLHRGWAGTDERKIPGEPLTITITGLPAGRYLWTSHHTDQADRSESVDVTLNDANGTVGPTLVEVVGSGNSGIVEFADIAKYEQVFTSDGVNPVSVEFVSSGSFCYVNAFLITNTNLPPDTGDLRVTGISLDGGSGDLLIDFVPSGPDHILTSSDDLFGIFTEEFNATLENGDSTFRVPASSLNPGMDFFRVEDAP